MRQVRRKIVDPSVRTYLLKAKEEGIKLSWNRFEEMLPQDGFGRLGLSCHDCLLGPCRLNPFGENEVGTICGLTKDDLVLRTLYRLVSNNDLEIDPTDLDCGCEDNDSLLGLVRCQTESMKKMVGSRKVQGVTRQVGLGVLKDDYINVCLEEASPVLMNMVQALVEELKEEATSRGAKGFNVVVAGDISPVFSFPSVNNIGGVEFAVLTGLLDSYIVGAKGLGLGRNAVSYYHTFFAQADRSVCKVKVKDWLIESADAYRKRDRKKVLASDQIGEVELIDLDKAMIKQNMDNGCIKGVCILGGGTNLKVTQDALICEAAVRLSSMGVLCLTYGNAAVTLGKYGYLQKAGDANALVSCVGAELDVVKILDLVEGLDKEKIIGLMPEIAMPRDISNALALAGTGVKVLTSINLPLEGSKAVGAEINTLINYCSPSEYVDEALNSLAL
ncbi:MAG: hypothetical protein APF84_08340 [Gracilibacter sp. BRH_c7a]|nr:MAG: hypothetical protein APF84_08340 [Gracilibacter sp. BRH_c7a]